jgi:hypothetical protein
MESSVPMRTTLDLEDDVFAAAKELARRLGTSAGKVVSGLLRSVLSGQLEAAGSEPLAFAGFRPFSACMQALVTNKQNDLDRGHALDQSARSGMRLKLLRDTTTNSQPEVLRDAE